jgi:hypothetical protein
MAEPARPAHAPAPVLLTRERVTVLVACILVALGSGTNYVRKWWERLAHILMFDAGLLWCDPSASERAYLELSTSQHMLPSSAVNSTLITPS